MNNNGYMQYVRALLAEDLYPMPKPRRLSYKVMVALGCLIAFMIGLCGGVGL